MLLCCVARHNKQKIIKRILNIDPKKNLPKEFWQREYKVFKDLLKLYPNLHFWNKVNFNFEMDSLRILTADFAKKILEKKYNEYHYIIPEQQKQTKLNDSKSGDDFIVSKKPKNLREFLS